MIDVTARVTHLFDRGAEDLYWTLRPAFDFASPDCSRSYRSSNADARFAAARALISSPLLVEIATGDDDLEQIAKIAGEMLGIRCVVIDARLILDHSNQMQKGSSSSSVSSVPLTSAPSRPSREELHGRFLLPLSEFVNPADIVEKYSPCMLMIRGLDGLLYGDLSGSAQSQQGDLDSQDEFAQTLETYLEDLFSAVEKRSHDALSQSLSSESMHNHTSLNHTESMLDALRRSMVLVVAGTHAITRLKSSVRSLFPSDLHLRGPSEEEVERWIVGQEEGDAVASCLAKQAASISSNGGSQGVSGSALECIVQEASRRSLMRIKGQSWMNNCGLLLQKPNNSKRSEADISSGELSVTADDVRRATGSLSRASAADLSRSGGRSGGASSTKISPVRWEDIGGLDAVRKEISNVLQLPLQRPELFPPNCAKRMGILLYGPPGTGKTLVARAVATENRMAFISIKGPELLDVYVGESERNVREVFANARRSAPCVLFFDELDSLAPARGRGSDGGGVMDRVVSQLLTEMDSLSTSTGGGNSPSSTLSLGSNGENKAAKGEGVFVVGATNRPDLLDPALLRPGRFDRKIYLSVCKDVASRAQILSAQTRKFKLADDVDLLEIAGALPVTVTGADIGAVTSAAYSRALRRKLDELRDAAVQSTSSSSSSFSSSTSSSSSSSHLANNREGSNDANSKASVSTRTSVTTAGTPWALAAFVNSLSPEELTVFVRKEDFLEAARTLKPSVSAEELVHYEGLGAAFSDVGFDR